MRKEPIFSLRYADRAIIRRVLELNQNFAAELSDLDEARLMDLIGYSFDASVVEDGEAFMIAFDQDAPYDSPNFEWFRSRHPRFVYVDRLAVSASARSRGYARMLYSHIFLLAELAEQPLVTCEVNLDPPNPASDTLHHSLGFEEIGRASLNAGKTVRYLQKWI